MPRSYISFCIDAALKPQVLMATRSPSARTRALALEVVAALVDRLREEYMTLLPEVGTFRFDVLI